ncbi:MAG: putative transporter [Muribaculaceae bacterium]|nr:putative transporter [Muribaculaceae bacterium]
MEWLNDIFVTHTPLQAVIVISVIIAVGLGLGKIQIFGVSLGVTWVFFAGILAGHLGLSVDQSMLQYAESFGLVLFVYELGLKVGPGFFSSFRKGGVKLNMLGLATVLVGTGLAVFLSYVVHIPMQDMVGIISGATTNTPSLGAAQQALSQVGLSANGAALSCAVTYPLGVVGVIIAIVLMRKCFVRTGDIISGNQEEENQTFIATFRVKNPGIYGKTVEEVAKICKTPFVISRIWHEGEVHVPTSEFRINDGDRLMIITTEREVEGLSAFLGEHESRDWNTGKIDWNKIDSSLTSRHIIISKPEINGHKLGSLKLRNNYGINITRVSRSGVSLLATPGLVLQLGDRLTVVGKDKQIDEVAKLLGNTESKLKDPNLAVIFIGIVLGLLLGSLPIMIPGISVPVRLGLAGGPIVVGILMGRFGPNLHMVTYTTRSANLMLRGIGLSLYLACLGLDAGAHFVETIFRGDGLVWIGTGFAITVIPVLIVGMMSMRLWKMDFGSTCGMVCGAMANPMALNYANDTLPGDLASVSYATVYPLAMFTRVVIAQLLVIIFI